MFREAALRWFSLCLCVEGSIAMLQGDWTAARRRLDDAVRSRLLGNFAGTEEACLLHFLARAGDERAPALLFELEPRLPRLGVANGHGSWAVLSSTVESAVLLGRRERAARLYPLVRQLLAEGSVLFY